MTSHNKWEQRIESVPCEQCGTVFDRKIFKGSDGVEHGFTNKLCSKCYEQESIKRQTEESQQNLSKIQERQREKWFSEYGGNGMFVDRTFENFNKELQPIAYQKLIAYQHGSLVLSSPNAYGVGKTHLVCALANKLVNNNETAYINKIGEIRTNTCPVHFETESKLLSRIRQSYNHKDGQESEEDIYQELLGFQLLIIDDVGKVRPKDYSFLQGVYFRVVDDFYVNERNIILTTNLDFKELEEHLGGSVADRLREMCGKDGFIKMTGKSYRSLK